LSSGDAISTTDTIPIYVDSSAEARFDLPTHSSQDQFLIVVSSLSRDAGPYSVEIRTQAADQAKPIQAWQRMPNASWRRRVDDHRKHLQLSRAVVETVEALTPAAKPAAERSFWVMVRGTDFELAKNYHQVRAELRATGEYCAVYVDKDCPPSERLDELIRLVRETFDRAVYPTAIRVLGRHRDVDGDGRFAILLTPWLSRLADGTVSLGGFVRGSDFYSDVDPPFGNHCDMMYLNADLAPGPHVSTLLAHEYTHAITLCEHVFNRYLPDRVGQEEESWLDESIAHLAENLHNYSWSNLDYRISAFLSDPERYRLVVDDYYAAGIWRGHGNRGSTYLFLRWCVDQHGEEILRDLVQTNLFGIESLEVAVGRPFDELYREWSLALYLGHSGLDRRPQDRLHFLSTREELNGRLLAGPRCDPVRLAGESCRFELVGTSSKYIIAHSPNSPATRVTIRAASGADLQVSVRRLPQHMARLEIHASRSEGSPAIELQVRECNGIPVRLKRMAWERSTRGTNRDADQGYCSPVLREPEIEQLFGSSEIPASGRLETSQFELQSHAAAYDPLLLKIMAEDESGHVISAWCALPPARRTVEQTAINDVPSTR
jgi:hypothetical protein